jgi:hypothetical protein
VINSEVAFLADSAESRILVTHHAVFFIRENGGAGCIDYQTDTENRDDKKVNYPHQLFQ